MELKVASCQILTYPDIEKSAEKVLTWIDRAKLENADVVTFPEACLCGYQIDQEYWDNAEPETFLRAEERVIECSRNLNIAVILGTAHWHEGRLFNSLLVIDKGGVVRGRYAKTHLAEKWPVPGTHIPVYSVAGVESCFIICHDIRYPELVRLPVLAGAQVCYFCSNEAGFSKEFKLSAYNAMPISRATENSIFLVMANVPGNLNDVKSPSQSHGNSKIVHPDGYVLAEANHFDERLVIATIDLNEANRKMALRSVNDENVLKDWMIEGVELIERPE